jgi:hypothetical protein
VQVSYEYAPGGARGLLARPPPELVVEIFVRNRGDGKSWVETFRDFQLNQRLGELRASIGERLAAIATKYDIDVEDQLRSIFPYQPD